MTIEEIQELIRTVCSTGIAELELQRGENRIWIKRTAGVVTQEIHVPQSAPAVQATAAPAPSAAPAAAHQAVPAQGEADLTEPGLATVKSPIVGTFYESPSPGSDPFVRVGDSVRPGKILCIIESMKLMNEIECEVSGTIVKRLVENGQPVEYGEALFLVKP
ncbi:MAG: acetyl-CoA carboxylase biotin carboxyl carrier protein [Acidobacteria bacterium]|nr:acetyl-CoA carboxylase biotin carboxyl carrier protein [Acidobacteriota bacterium]